MKTGALGKEYQDGEMIFKQGQPGDLMYVIQEGKVEVFLERNGTEVPLRLCHEGDFLGEMALFKAELRSVNARSSGRSRLLSVDNKNFLRRIHEDPTIAFRLVQVLLQRIRELDEDVAVLSRALHESLAEQFTQR